MFRSFITSKFVIKCNYSTRFFLTDCFVTLHYKSYETFFHNYRAQKTKTSLVFVFFNVIELFNNARNLLNVSQHAAHFKIGQNRKSEAL